MPVSKKRQRQRQPTAYAHEVKKRQKKSKPKIEKDIDNLVFGSYFDESDAFAANNIAVAARRKVGQAEKNAMAALKSIDIIDLCKNLQLACDAWMTTTYAKTDVESAWTSIQGTRKNITLIMKQNQKVIKNDKDQLKTKLEVYNDDFMFCFDRVKKNYQEVCHIAKQTRAIVRRISQLIPTMVKKQTK